MSGTIKYSEDLTNLVNEVLMSELEGMDFEEELEGSNSKFAIMCTVVSDNDCMPTGVYGVYNRATGIRETETRQLGAAVLWAEALANPEKAKQDSSKPVTFPGLESKKPTNH